MGRAPCCDKANVKKGPWSPEEDTKLQQFIEKHGTGGNWIALPQKVGLRRCGKSCRLRWLNYLRPNIKHGEFSDEEDRVIINLFANIGSRWSIIAAQLPGRTDNDIKNYWNTKLKKKLMGLINNNNQPNQPRKLNHHNIASSTNNNNNSISYLLQPNSSSASYTSHHHHHHHHQPQQGSFEPKILSSCSYMNNIQIAPQESLTSFMMFGHNSYGDHQASCSSSDGKSASYEDSMVSNGIVNLNAVNSAWGSTSSSTIDHQSNDNKNNNNNNNNNSVLDYGLEEINQLISGNNSTNTSSCGNNFLYDEDKTDQERLLYYHN